MADLVPRLINNGREGDSEILDPVIPVVGSALLRPEEEGSGEGGTGGPVADRIPDVPEPDSEPEEGHEGTDDAWINDAFGADFIAPLPGPFDPTLTALQQSQVTQFDDDLDFSLSPQPVLIDSFAGNDRIIGSVFGDNIQSGAGNDTVMGGPGDDELDGDSGFDIAVYKGSILQYAVTRIDGDEFDVSDMSHNLRHDLAPSAQSDGSDRVDEGTDELEDFEAIRFADYLLRLDGTNNAPFVVAEDLVIPENGPAQITFQIYDFDGDPVLIDSITSESGAVITPIIPTGDPQIPTFFGRAFQASYLYIPNPTSLVAGEFAVDTITFSVTDTFPAIAIPIGGPAFVPRIPQTTTVTVNVNMVGVNDPLTANDDVAAVDEDKTLEIDVLANDTSDGNEALFVREATAANGSIEILENGTLNYTPDTNFNGVDTITYAIWNGTESSYTDTAQVSVTVAPINDPPEAQADRASTNEDVPVNIDVLANDTDIDGDILTVLTASAANGTVNVESDNTLTYTPNLNFNGRDQITYMISDGNGGTDTGFVGVTITPVNDDPIGVDDTVAPILEDGMVVIDVLANDFDVDGDSPLVITGFGTQLGGVAALTNDGQMRFTAAKDFNGPAQVQYFISDGNGGTGSALVDLVITPVNDAPTTTFGSIVADEDDGLITIQLRDFANDVDGDVLSFSDISANRAGTLIPFTITDDTGPVQPFENGLITFDPEILGLDSGESAQTTFTFTVNDNSGDTGNDTATGTFDLTINGADEPSTPPVFDGVTNLAVTADEGDGAIRIPLSDLVTDGSIEARTANSLITNNYLGLGITTPRLFTVSEGPDGPVLVIEPDQLYIQGGETEPSPPAAGDSILSEGETGIHTLTIDVLAVDGFTTTTATVSLTLVGDTPGADDPTNQPPTGGGSLGDIIVDDPSATTFTFDLDAFASDDYFGTDSATSPLAFTIGDLVVGNDDSTWTLTSPTVTFNNTTNEVTIDLAAIDALLDDDTNGQGVLHFTISDGTFTVNAEMRASFVDPLDSPPDPVPVPDEFILDFEEFSSDPDSNIQITGSKGFVFSGNATVVETDEISGARTPGGTINGQTTDPGDNILVALPSTITTSETLLDSTGAPERDEEGNLIVVETTVVDAEFAIQGPGSALVIGENGAFIGSGLAGGTPPPLPVALPEDVGQAFDLNSLSLNPSSGESVIVTMTTYDLGVTEVVSPFNTSFASFYLNLVERDSFDFTVNASTPALEIDFDDATLPGGIANPDPTVFDDLYAVEFTTADGTAIILDDISLSLVSDAVPI
ncbi:tandem-95 repeat protein [Rhodobacteraceae bacterium M382]|nr:tandem-95 repeat protein [Rhodobacteraceae bacterium M382]